MNPKEGRKRRKNKEQIVETENKWQDGKLTPNCVDNYFNS